MTNSTTSLSKLQRVSVSWRDYLELCKPRVVALMILTSIVGMCLATPNFIPLHVLILGNLGIALSAGSAAVLNHLVDRHIDHLMIRTKHRPIVRGKVSPKNAIIFALILGLSGMWILTEYINALTAILTFITLIGYAGVYTIYLKHATPQNIVIGGLAGAAPPLLGWVAVTGHITAASLLLTLIIFVWTPPHFWALAIHRFKDYEKANIPMLPNTHGIRYTKIQILLYTILLFAISLLPFAIKMVGYVYLMAALLLNFRFLFWAICLLKSERKDIPMKMFRYSIIYLMLIFVAMVADHYLHFQIY